MYLSMGPVTEAVYRVMSEQQPFDRADYVLRLAELPATGRRRRNSACDLPRSTTPPGASGQSSQVPDKRSPIGNQKGGTSWNGRTSIGSVVAAAALRPHTSAASRSGAVIT